MTSASLLPPLFAEKLTWSCAQCPLTKFADDSLLHSANDNAVTWLRYAANMNAQMHSQNKNKTQMTVCQQ